MTAIQDNTSSKRQKRNIRFHERVQFKTIRHVSEFSDAEIKNGWYDKDDFNRMSDNVSEIAKLISDGETTLNGEELCTRGLEHIVEEELADYRAEKMINSIDAVLDEQEEQWDEGNEEPGLIAELYAEYAKPLLREAHLIGLKDAEQGYKNWDDLLDEKDYQHLTVRRTESSPVDCLNSNGKKEKVAKAKKIKKGKKSDDSLQERQNVSKSVKQNELSSKMVTSKDKIVSGKMKVKKNEIKKSNDSSVEEQLFRNKATNQHVPVSQIPVSRNHSHEVSQTEKDSMKKQVKKSNQFQNSVKFKPSSCTDVSSSSSSLQSSTSSLLSPQTSTMSLQKSQNSISSINSCTLRDLSIHSTPEDFDTNKNSSAKGKKNNTTLMKSKLDIPLQRNEEGQKKKSNNSVSSKKQGKRNGRRSASARKHGTELSPFVFRRDGTLAFRKPDVEKLKREQKQKRKNFVEGSLTKFLQCDDEEEDILAGILSGAVK